MLRRVDLIHGRTSSLGYAFQVSSTRIAKLSRKKVYGESFFKQAHHSASASEEISNIRVTRLLEVMREGAELFSECSSVHLFWKNVGILPSFAHSHSVI